MKKTIILIMAMVSSLVCGCVGAPAEESSSDSPSEPAVVSETSEETTKKEVEKVDYKALGKPLVALTFDDGPNITTTVQVLDVLEEYGVRGSFFLVGNNISDSTKDVVKRAYDMGCEINNHSKTHSDMTKMTPEEITAEIDFVRDKVKEITGEDTKFFRPPYIAVNQTMYDAVDMPFIAGAGCNDWEDKVSAEERAERTLKQVKDGTIVLLHDMQGNSKTVEALKTIIPELQKQGYEFVTVSELFEAKDIEISGDDTGLYTVVG
ncbi:MAG: polysaccharide deacetylase family protein [Oscillospiraceae bacterium]|nr:polysaccharide deacetylase family protein [Oscillospiraceae bacterium]